MGNARRVTGRVGLRSGLFVVALLVSTAGFAQPDDSYLEGYVAAVLERELGLARDEYAVEVVEGVAHVTLYGGARQGREAVAGRLGNIADLKAVELEGRQRQPAPEPEPSVMGVTADSRAFPLSNLFRPLLADPKEPRFFVSARAYRTERASFNGAAVGYGETFGLKRWRGTKPNRGLQVGVSGGLFALFNLDTASFDLVNADYMVGLPLTYRYDTFSARVRLYHQSSHLGDEFLLRTRPERVNLSYESLETLVSYDLGPWRLYGGGEYLIHREPEDLDRWLAHGGIEYYGSWSLWGGRPLLGVDLKSFEEHNWSLDASVKVGLAYGGLEPGRRSLRVMMGGFKGFSPHGQFYTERTEYLGLGVSLGF